MEFNAENIEKVDQSILIGLITDMSQLLDNKSKKFVCYKVSKQDWFVPITAIDMFLVIHTTLGYDQLRLIIYILW